MDKESEPQSLSSKKNFDNSLLGNRKESVKNEHTRDQPMQFIYKKSTELSPLSQLLENKATKGIKKSEDYDKLPLSQLTQRQQDNNPLKESLSVSPLSRVLKEKQTSSSAAFSTPARVQHNKGSVHSHLSNAEQTKMNETEELKSLIPLIEQSSRSKDSLLSPLLSALTIKDTSKSPLSLLLGVEQVSGNKKPLSKKTSPLASHSTPLVKIPTAERSGLSPLSQLLKEKHSSVGDKMTEESSQKVSHVVHIPKNDGGSSPLSKLLKTRQSPAKDIDYDTKDELDGKSNFSINKNYSSSKTLSPSFKQISRNPESTSAFASDISSVSNINKEIDLCALLTSTKSDKKQAKLGKRTALVLPGKNPPLSSPEVVMMDLDQNDASLDSVLELLHSPSLFACTLLVCYKRPGNEWKPTLMERYQNDVGIVPFNFSEPSPDDVVKSKQKLHLKEKKHTGSSHVRPGTAASK